MEEEKKKYKKTPSQAATSRYIKANYDRIELTIPKGYKLQLKSAAEHAGLSVNNYITIAVCEKMGIEPPEKHPLEKITKKKQGD